MKKNIRALTLAAVLLVLAPAVGGREKPNPDDFEFEGIETGPSIGEKATMAASALVMDACDAFGGLGKIWIKKGQNYSQTVSDWYGACDNMQTAWNDSWAKIIELAKAKLGGGEDFAMPAPWLTWERAHRSFFTEVRNKGLVALLFYRTVQRRRAQMDKDLEDNFAKRRTMLADVKNVSGSVAKIRAAIAAFDRGAITKSKLKGYAGELAAAETTIDLTQRTALNLQKDLNIWFKEKLNQPLEVARRHKKLLEKWGEEAENTKIVERYFAISPYAWAFSTQNQCTKDYNRDFADYRIAMVGILDGKLFQEIRHFEMVKFEYLKDVVKSVRILFDNRVG